MNNDIMTLMRFEHLKSLARINNLRITVDVNGIEIGHKSLTTGKYDTIHKSISVENCIAFILGFQHIYSQIKTKSK